MNVTFIINNINPDLFPDFDPQDPPHTTSDGVDEDAHDLSPIDLSTYDWCFTN